MERARQRHAGYLAKNPELAREMAERHPEAFARTMPQDTDGLLSEAERLHSQNAKAAPTPAQAPKPHSEMDDWLAENEKFRQTFNKMQSGQPLTEEERGRVLGASAKWNARQQSKAEGELRKAAAIQDLAGREENLRAVQTSGKVGELSPENVRSASGPLPTAQNMMD
jgi:hypothetical protein